MGTTRNRGILLLVLLLLCVTLNGRAIPAGGRPLTGEREQIAISYADLVDTARLVRTGETIADSLRGPIRRGLLQPFFEPRSSALSPIVSLQQGAGERPFVNVVDLYAHRPAEPAWCALLRGGRMQIAADLAGTARVFLQGDDPEALYRRHYPVIRHPLAKLAPQDAPLTVEVYAFTNDYASRTLRLDPRPYVVEREGFPPRGAALDLEALEAFFGGAGALAGARLDSREGLVLYAEEGEGTTLLGKPVSLADLAVAYRAAVHCGDNEPFISLDPHRDPTRVNVNLGGYLEGTRIGAVVLAADKRFKTLTCGLDPDSRRDIRETVRRRIPSFRTSSEVDLLQGAPPQKDWIGARFWFYPESVRVETGRSGRSAYIASPTFTADAERSRGDFASARAFERDRRAALPASIRRNIDHLNAHYDAYAELFPELDELRSAARLMGIAAWLRQTDTGALDLDALLAVEIPKVETPEEQTQLLAVSVLAEGRNATPADIAVHALSDRFRRQVEAVFPSPEEYAAFQALRPDSPGPAYREVRHRPLASILETRDDLEAFGMHAGGAIAERAPTERNALDHRLGELRGRLDRKRKEIEQAKAELDRLAGNPEAYNRQVGVHNRRVAEYEGLRNRYNSAAERYNRLAGRKTTYIVEIGGGINLEPRHFTITRDSADPAFAAFRQAAAEADSTPGGLRSSGPTRTTAHREPPEPAIGWTSRATRETAGARLVYGESPEVKHWTLRETARPVTRTQLRWIATGRTDVYRFDRENGSAAYARYDGGTALEGFQARTTATGAIVLTPLDGETLAPPTFPPRWWE
ncbi:MAG: hypothetical protein K9L28_10530 [Synergistales bacterium]|nr:hypothetical protein [Synergistales bacterium]